MVPLFFSSLIVFGAAVLTNVVLESSANPFSDKGS